LPHNAIAPIAVIATNGSHIPLFNSRFLYSHEQHCSRE